MLNFIQDQQLILPVKNTFRIIKSTAPCFRIFQGYVFVLWKSDLTSVVLPDWRGPVTETTGYFFANFRMAADNFLGIILCNFNFQLQKYIKTLKSGY